MQPTHDMQAESWDRLGSRWGCKQRAHKTPPQCSGSGDWACEDTHTHTQQQVGFKQSCAPEPQSRMQSSACSMQQQHSQAASRAQHRQHSAPHTHSSRGWWLCRGAQALLAERPPHAHQHTAAACRHTNTLCTAPAPAVQASQTPASSPDRRSAPPAQHPAPRHSSTTSTQHNEHTDPPGVPTAWCFIGLSAQSAVQGCCQGAQPSAAAAACWWPHCATACPAAAAAAPAHVPKATTASMMQSVVHCACLDCKQHAASHISRTAQCVCAPARAPPASAPCECASLPGCMHACPQPTASSCSGGHAREPVTNSPAAAANPTTTIDNPKHIASSTTRLDKAVCAKTMGRASDNSVRAYSLPAPLQRDRCRITSIPGHPKLVSMQSSEPPAHTKQATDHYHRHDHHDKSCVETTRTTRISNKSCGAG